MNIDELEDEVRESILSNLGFEKDEDFDKGAEAIRLMNTWHAFDCYLKWHGIIGYTGKLIQAYENIKASSKS